MRTYERGQIQQLMVKRVQLVNFKQFSKGRFRFGSLYSSSTLRFTPSTSFLMHQHRLMTESRNLSFFTQRDCHPQPHLGYMSDYSTYVRKVGRLASKSIRPRNSLRTKHHKSVRGGRQSLMGGTNELIIQSLLVKVLK